MNFKTCRICRKRKSLERFGPNAARRDGRQSACRICYRDQEKVRERGNRLRVVDYFRDHPCVDCGETDPIVLTFDHRNPEEKVERISSMLGRRLSWRRIEDEIAKCDVMCANCHARRTAKQQGWEKAQ